MKPALLVIDIQKDFYQEDEVSAKLLQSAVDYLNYIIPLFREKGYPVICIQHMVKAHGFVPGHSGFDIPDDLPIEEGDIRIYKEYSNSFNKTELKQKLEELSVDTVFITGYSALHCVLATYRGAQDLDLKPIFIRGAISGGTPEEVKMAEQVGDIISYGALRAFFEL
ncbi:MAG: isochorismatase family protein [Anaerolineae bacterium]|jgi:nicotinamidase-related amidase|nr:isochorismatase family protein [Anaerolineae bacterium]